MTPRPSILAPDLTVCARLARDLGFRKQWVVWRLEHRSGKWTKPPLMLTGNPASSTDPGTWCHYDAAAAAAQGFDGIGFVLTAEDPFVAIDLDHCIDRDGALDPESQAIVREIDSYSERSPSGTGVRILARGRKPGSRSRVGSVEVYDHARFVTVTGAHLAGTPTSILDRSDDLAALYARLWPCGSPGEIPAVPPADGLPSLEERVMLIELLDLDPELRALHTGRWVRRRSRWWSQSEADASYCYKLLAMGCTPDQVQRLFRSSALYRDKTDSRRPGGTYISRTIANMQAQLREARLG